MKIFDLINKEKRRQEDEICLIASENYTSKNVMKAVGSILTNKYAEGYPGKRYYGGCHIIDEIEQYAMDKCRELFGCKYVNVQPHSGSQANQAVYQALLKPGDTILGMSLDSGGHLTHGSKVSSSGKLYNAISYGLDDDGYLDYEEIEELLYNHHPRLLIIGASAYPRKIDFKKIRRILGEYNEGIKEWINFFDKKFEMSGSFGPAKSQKVINDCEGMEIITEIKDGKFDKEDCYNKHKCYFMVDMAHIAGLVAANLHQSPIPYADIVTSTTHKTLRGPRGGIILTNDEELAKKIDKSVFPGNQGGPLEHIIAGKAICFEEALTKEFRDYQRQVLRNIKAMERIFRENRVEMVSGGSDNHLILLDLTRESITGRQLEETLEQIGIICNKNAVQNDRRSKLETSGIRIGTAAMTTRGMKEKEAEIIAELICKYTKEEILMDSLMFLDDDKKLVKRLCKKFPIYKKKGLTSVKKLFRFF